MRKWLKQCIFSIFILIGILFIPSTVSALDLKLTYDGTLDKCISDLNILPSYDNNGNIDGYLYVHSNGIIKQDLNNKIVYNKEEYIANSDVESIDASNTEDYVVKGEMDALIKIYDDNDNLIFTKQFGGNGIGDISNIFYNYNDNGVVDGYIFLFATTSTDLGIEPGFGFAKLDLKGNIVWIKNINKYLQSNNQLIYLENETLFTFDIFDNSIVEKYNAVNGEKIFEKDTGIYISNINYSYNKDGVIDGFVVAGYDDDFGILIKYDLDGNEIFRTKYDNSDTYSTYYGVISSRLPDGSYDGYIVTATVGSEKTLLLKYDYTGKKTSEIVYSSKYRVAFKLFDNYDSTGRQNGYLLLGIPLKILERQVETYYKVSCQYFAVVKYTYDIFDVVKEDSNEGIISVKNDALPGELVKVNVLVKEGYSLQKIIVKDENGKEIEVNSDGTFVMPEGKVTVSAIYKRVTNPDTVSAAYMVLGVILIASVGSMIVIKKRNDM